MHSSFKVADQHMMASDGMCSGKPNFGGFGLSLATKTEAEAEKLFAALSEGGQVQQPLIKTFFSPKFGTVADKFGVVWMVLVEQAPPA
jgi:PhnB protein